MWEILIAYVANIWEDLKSIQLKASFVKVSYCNYCKVSYCNFAIFVRWWSFGISAHKKRSTFINDNPGYFLFSLDRANENLSLRKKSSDNLCNLCWRSRKSCRSAQYEGSEMLFILPVCLHANATSCLTTSACMSIDLET